MQISSSPLPSASLNQDIYTDLSSLDRLRKQAQVDPEKTLKTVAQQFESLFMQMVLKSMRKASFGDPIFDSSQSKFYQDMFDKQLSLTLSQGRGMGMTEVLEKQLQGSLHPSVKTVSTSAHSAPLQDHKHKLSMPVLNSAPVKDHEHKLSMPVLNSASVKDHEHKLSMPVLNSAPVKDHKHKLSMPVLNSVSVKDHKHKLSMPVLNTVGVVYQKTAVRPVADKNMPAFFSSPQDFVRQLMPLAQKAAHKLGVKPEVLLAQAALETGWGQHISRHTDGSSSHNLFNIKAGNGWDGDRVGIHTLEYRNGLARHERAAFRAYGSYADSFSDYVNFLKSGSRYQSALKKADDPKTFIRELHGAGYATDPDYANKVIDIMQRPMLQAAIENGTRHAG